MHLTLTPVLRGCEAWVVREGYEGLVRGNTHQPSDSRSCKEDGSFIHNLRFGDGELLKDGTGDYIGGRSLKGRYIVRVGWDDVRGWFGEVSYHPYASSSSVYLLGNRVEHSSALRGL